MFYILVSALVARLYGISSNTIITMCEEYENETIKKKD